jgi:hypothetical protein
MGILNTAKELIYGERENDYGHPAINLQKIAVVWSALLQHKLQADITAQDVCGLMAALKLVRAAKDNWTHEDSIIDAAGYLGLLDRIKE